MALSFSKLVRSMLEAIFGLGGEWIRPVTYVRPVGFNASTGLTEPVEVTATCRMLLLNYRPMDLSFAPVVPGQEKILIRSGELAGVIEPGAGDYLRQEATLEVWEVIGSRMDVTGEYWLFQVLRSANRDWGGLDGAHAGGGLGGLDVGESTRGLGSIGLIIQADFMSKQVRLRRGTTLQHLSFVGAEGEVTYDTERKCLMVHDGVSLGGRAVMVLTPGNPALTQLVTSPVALSGGSSSLTGLTVYNAALLSGPTTIGDLMSPTVTMGGAGGVIVDFTAGRLQMVTPVLSDISLTSANRLPSRCCWVFLTCGATGRNVSFPAGWKFVGGAAPSSIAANKTALLELWCLGSSESDVMARWSAQT